MDLDNLLQLERAKLLSDKERLSARLCVAFSSGNSDRNILGEKPDINNKCNFLQSAHNEELKRKSRTKETEKTTNNADNMDFLQVDDLCPAVGGGGRTGVATPSQKHNIQVLSSSFLLNTVQTSSMATPPPTSTLPAVGEEQQMTQKVQNVSINNSLTPIGSQYGKAGNILKIEKDLANLERHSKVALEDDIPKTQRFRHRTKDDMEQWVTDTFYSYFPGFNNENQKRQSYLRDRQLEYQQNFLKHQMTAQVAKMNNNKNAGKNSEQSTSRAPQPQPSSSTSRSADKTELEIIVNNPNYETARTPRPGSTRHKLLQDLQHTEISKIVNSDVVSERNRRNAEVEIDRKKDYQKDLMLQIEEKRRSIEAIREKERLQDEALTRKLQEQLKTIQLEEDLEKEKLRADKVRFDIEQNRLMREHLLSKLENDTKLLGGKTKSENDKDSPKPKGKDTATTAAADKNKVYKYFSNSARHEYHRDNDRLLAAANAAGGADQCNEFDLEIADTGTPLSTNRSGSNDVERECFHLSEKVCPLCDAPLKRYEGSCLKCERKLSLKQHNSKRHSSDSQEAAICENCQRLYALCGRCVQQDDICRACHQKRHICMSCRQNLCSFCLGEVATGKDVEKDDTSRSHQKNPPNTNRKSTTSRKFDSPESERSFEILEVNYPPASLTKAVPDDASNFLNNNDSTTAVRRPPPFSMNIDRNSIFHPNYLTHEKLQSKRLFDVDDETDFERVRSETDKRLSRYLKNYGDLATKATLTDRSTQTTPDGSARRDVVMVEENNLSMPLLREMPKMTRKESTSLQEKAAHNNRTIENLKRRWEIPAVQRQTITKSSPKVLTQLGAIRKQLQEEQLQFNY